MAHRERICGNDHRSLADYLRLGLTQAARQDAWKFLDDLFGDGRVAVFGSKAGATSHPDWYYNVHANPDVTIELGADTREMNAHVATGDERAAIWDPWKTANPVFAEYEQKAGDREIPVVVLEPR